MMHAIIVGCSGAIAMNLTVCKKQVEKQLDLYVFFFHHHHHHHHHSFALVKEENIQITSQGNGKETSRNHQAY